MDQQELAERRARHKLDDHMPSTTLYSRKNPGLVKYVRLYEDTVSDEEGSTSEEEVADTKRSQDKKKKKDDKKKAGSAAESKYSHSRFSSKVSDIDDEILNAGLPGEADIGQTDVEIKGLGEQGLQLVALKEH